MVHAIILAGGVGKRMGIDLPKQFIDVLGKPIIVYTLEVFDNHPEVDDISVVCVENYIDTVRLYIKQYNLKKVVHVISGGSTFDESVRCGVYNLKNCCNADDIVLLHMSVSPMVSEDLISDAIDVAVKHGLSISAEPCYLCMCEQTGESCSDKYLNREVIYGMNTPWGFRYETILNTYERAERCKHDISHDPHTSTMLIDFGETLYFSKSSLLNIKITTQEELDLFEGYRLLQNKRNLNRGDD